MASAGSGTAYRHLCDLFTAGSVVGLEDGPLLTRYCRSKDPAAFESLVGRHGPMVLATCRAVLRNEQDIEDAFQATFLVLAKKADSIQGAETLGGWLHRVAYRASVQASIESRKRRRKEAEAAVGRWEATRGEKPSDRLDQLHEEIDRLPGSLRQPVVLCDLEGLTYEEAARQLGWTLPSLRHRLANGRERLRARLARQGTFPLALAPSPPSPALIRSAVASATGGPTSIGATLLTHIMLRGMFMTRLKFVSAVAISGIALASAGVLAATGGSPPKEPGPAMKPTAQAGSASKPAAVAEVKPGETVEIRGIVVEPSGKPVSGAAVRGSDMPTGSVPPQATSGPDGRFTIQLPKLRPELQRMMAEYYLLIAYHPGHGIGWTQGVLRADRPAESVVTLAEEGPPIEGRIVNLEGRPIAGASVKVDTVWFEEKGNFATWIDQARKGAAGNLWQGLRQLKLEKLFPIEAKTDADGRFQLSGIGRERIAQLIIKGPEVATTQAYVFGRDEPEIRGVDRNMIRPTPFIVHAPKFQLALMPTKRVKGIARDQETGQPIAGLVVLAAVFDESSMIPAPGIEARTDAEGRYQFDGLPRAAAYRLFIRPEKALPYPSALLKVAAETPGLEPVAYDFKLKQGIMIRGKITDKATGQPVVGLAHYYALATNPHIDEYPGFKRSYAAQTTIDSDGGYELVALPGPGLVAVRDEEGRHLPASGFEKIPGYDTKMKGFPTSSHYVPAGGNAILVGVDVDPKNGPLTINMQADPGQSLAVEVVDPDGRPLGGTKVKGMSESLVTVPMPQESSGFEVHAIDPGRPRRLIVMHEGRKLIGSILLSGKMTGPITIKLEPWGTLAARIVDDEGKPLKGMFLGCPTGSLNPHPETDDILPWTDWNSGVRIADDGRFLIEGLVPGLKYAANTRGGMRPAMIGGDLFDGVIVAPGEARNLGDLKIKARKP